MPISILSVNRYLKYFQYLNEVNIPSMSKMHTDKPETKKNLQLILVLKYKKMNNKINQNLTIKPTGQTP